MKILSLNLSLEGLDLSPETKELTNVELTARVIKNIIFAYGTKTRGLGEEDRRKFYKISDVMDAAIKEEKDSIELEDDWFGFLKKCKREGLLMPDTLLRRVEDLIEAVPSR